MGWNVGFPPLLWSLWYLESLLTLSMLMLPFLWTGISHWLIDKVGNIITLYNWWVLPFQGNLALPLLYLYLFLFNLHVYWWKRHPVGHIVILEYPTPPKLCHRTSGVGTFYRSRGYTSPHPRPLTLQSHTFSNPNLVSVFKNNHHLK